MFFLKLINRILLLNFLTYHYKRWYIKVSPMSIFHRILLLKSTSVMFFYFVIWLHFELCTWKAKWSKRMNEHSHWICTIKTPTIWLAFGEGEKNITGWGKNSDWRANGKWRVCTYSNLPMFRSLCKKISFTFE